MKILKTASLESSFTSSYKKRVYSVKVFEQVRKTNEKQILKKFENWSLHNLSVHKQQRCRLHISFVTARVTLTCSKSSTETLEKGAKYVQS